MRRIVIGNGADGRSTLLQDGPPALIYHFRTGGDPHSVKPERVSVAPEAVAPGESLLAELWLTDEAPSAESAATGADPTAVEGPDWAVECPPNGTRWRMAVYGSGLTAPMHRTSTLDYDVILSGSVDLLLEDGTELTLTAGDSVVIPGVAHGWRAGPEGCTKFVVMQGLEP
jgi:quercetin dioxygenase-like cupin family protein